MAKRSKRPKGRSKKWSRANTMNFVLGGIVALSMILGSVFVFGGATPGPAPAATASIIATAVPPVVQENPTPTVIVTPAAAPSPTPAPSPTR